MELHDRHASMLGYHTHYARDAAILPPISAAERDHALRTHAAANRAKHGRVRERELVCNAVGEAPVPHSASENDSTDNSMQYLTDSASVSSGEIMSDRIHEMDLIEEELRAQGFTVTGDWDDGTWCMSLGGEDATNNSVLIKAADGTDTAVRDELAAHAQMSSENVYELDGLQRKIVEMEARHQLELSRHREELDALREQVSFVMPFCRQACTPSTHAPTEDPSSPGSDISWHRVPPPPPSLAAAPSATCVALTGWSLPSLTTLHDVALACWLRCSSVGLLSADLCRWNSCKSCMLCMLSGAVPHASFGALAAFYVRDIGI